MKEIILRKIQDLASDFLYYDRKGDADLSIDELNSAIVDGTITLDEVINEFRAALAPSFK